MTDMLTRFLASEVIYCRFCGEMIDGLGREIGKTACFDCEQADMISTALEEMGDG